MIKGAYGRSAFPIHSLYLCIQLMEGQNFVGKKLISVWNIFRLHSHPSSHRTAISMQVHCISVLCNLWIAVAYTASFIKQVEHLQILVLKGNPGFTLSTSGDEQLCPPCLFLSCLCFQPHHLHCCSLCLTSPITEFPFSPAALICTIPASLLSCPFALHFSGLCVSLIVVLGGDGPLRCWRAGA